MGRKLSADAVANTVTTVPAGAKIALLTTDPDNKYITAENFAADADFSALYQGLDATLTSLASLGTAADKLAYTTGVDTWAETAFTAFGRSLVDDADASTAQATLGLVIGTNVQAYDADLSAIAALNPTANNLIYKNGGDAWDTASLTAFARTLLDDANDAAARATLGVTIDTDVQAYSANLTAIAALAVTDGNIIVGNGSTWVAESGATARTSLGLAIGTDVQAYSATLAAVAAGTYTGAASITTVGTLTSGAINWTGAITTTGTLSAGATTVTGTLTLSSASSPRINGSTTLGYVDIFGDSAATSGVRILDTGELLLGATSTSSDAQFYAVKSYSASSGTDIGGYFNYTQSAATTGALRGLQTTTNVTAISGTVASARGITATARVTSGSATTTSLYGLVVELQNSSGSATVTNGYGLYIDAFTATGTITNRWGIYQAGASENNYFAGSLRIGTTSAFSTESLAVSGGIHQVTAGGAWLKLGDSNNTVEITSVEVSGSSALAFKTAAVERGRWASNAYALGIGTTDVEVWDANFGAIEFGRSAIMGENGGEMIVMLSNIYRSSGGAYTYKASSLNASAYFQNAGVHSWYSIASGTADNPVTLGTADMTLSLAGNLLLATTTDPTSAVGALVLGNGTAPSAAAADTVSLYSKDRSAGNTMLGIRSEGTAFITGTPAAATGAWAVEINGTTVYLTGSTTAPS